MHLRWTWAFKTHMFFPTFIMISTNDFLTYSQCCWDSWIRLVPGVWEKWWKIWNQPGNNFNETFIRSYMMEMQTTPPPPYPDAPFSFSWLGISFPKLVSKDTSSCLKEVDKKFQFPPVARWGDKQKRDLKLLHFTGIPKVFFRWQLLWSLLLNSNM